MFNELCASDNEKNSGIEFHLTARGQKNKAPFIQGFREIYLCRSKMRRSSLRDKWTIEKVGFGPEINPGLRN